MKKTLTIVTIAIAGIIISGLIFGAGFFVSRSNFGFNGNGLTRMNQDQAPWDGIGNSSRNVGQSYGMVGNGYDGSNSYGMMGNVYQGTKGFGMMGNGYNGTQGNGMMGNLVNNPCGSGMMGYFGNDGNTTVEPISMDQAKQAFEDYLIRLNNSDLELKEIMIFDNNAYARIVEKSTGIGAMELLMDPASLSVFPEYGPNMMWNLKYGHMGGYGGMMGGYGGMMDNRNYNSESAIEDMSVTSEQALKAAQDFLDQDFPGYQTSEDADPFYGYYTIDILKDGTPTGMLSVNGFNEQVFIHSWHGTFIEMFE
jgi:hypothetical protein